MDSDLESRNRPRGRTTKEDAYGNPDFTHPIDKNISRYAPYAWSPKTHGDLLTKQNTAQQEDVSSQIAEGSYVETHTFTFLLSIFHSYRPILTAFSWLFLLRYIGNNMAYYIYFPITDNTSGIIATDSSWAYQLRTLQYATNGLVDTIYCQSTSTCAVWLEATCNTHTVELRLQSYPRCTVPVVTTDCANRILRSCYGLPLIQEGLLNYLYLVQRSIYIWYYSYRYIWSISTSHFTACYEWFC